MWTVGDVDSHRKGLDASQKKTWVKIANGTLKACQDGKLKPKNGDDCDATAIKIANSHFSKKKESIQLVGEQAYINIFETLDNIFKVEEADIANRIAPIDIIKVGWSKNKRFYPKSAVEKIAALATHRESRKMFMDHPRSFEDFFSRSLRDWTATVKEAYFDAKEEKASAKVQVLNNHNGWIWDQIMTSPADVGVSINAIGEVVEDDEKGSTSGRKNGLIVKEIHYLISPDFVTVPAAGGRAHKPTESFDFTSEHFTYLPFMEEQRYQEEVVTPLIESILNEGDVLLTVNKQEDVSMDNTIEALKSVTLEDLKKAGNPIIDLEIEKIVKSKADESVKQAVTPLNEEIASLKKENGELIAKVAQKDEEIAQVKEELNKLTSEKKEVEAKTFVESVAKEFPADLLPEARKTRWLEMAKVNQELVKTDAAELKAMIEKSKGTKTETISNPLTKPTLNLAEGLNESDDNKGELSKDLRDKLALDLSKSK